MSKFPIPRINTRLGLHYFPDAVHYRTTNLRNWVPELHALGISWLTLHAPNDRAIPEAFLKGLMDQNIEPILHFKIPIDDPHQLEDNITLFSTYARWGVNYIVLFDRPNSRAAWSTTDWTQVDLVERFLDRYLPHALSALNEGLIPIFPPLEPGGDYWDTSFLKTSLQAIKRRGHQEIIDNLIVGAYANARQRPITWGRGGPQRWPKSQPYTSNPGTEDQCGFFIFDWYIPIIEYVTQKPATLILFEAGAQLNEINAGKITKLDLEDHTLRNLSLFESVSSDLASKSNLSESKSTNPIIDPVPAQVISSNFWLLSAALNSPHIPNAWYKPDGTTLPVVEAVYKFVSENLLIPKSKDTLSTSALEGMGKSISHYLLLPSYEWGVVDWHLDLIRPFVKQYQPTIGFSLEEASKAAKVSIVGGVQAFTQDDLNMLKTSGCIVNRISRDGTSIATGNLT